MTLEAAVHAAETLRRRTFALARRDALLGALSPAPRPHGSLDPGPRPRVGGPVLRAPLRDRVIIPTLVEGVLARAPGCARVLARQDLFTVQRRAPADNPLLRLPPDLRRPEGLLHVALRRAPSDGLRVTTSLNPSRPGSEAACLGSPRGSSMAWRAPLWTRSTRTSRPSSSMPPRRSSSTGMPRSG